jgi:hypothetical protein
MLMTTDPGDLVLDPTCGSGPPLDHHRHVACPARARPPAPPHRHLPLVRPQRRRARSGRRLRL